MLTGWRQVAGLDSIAGRDEKTQQQLGILADYLSEQAYGAWFHNAGIVSERWKVFCLTLTYRRIRFCSLSSPPASSPSSVWDGDG